MQPCWVRQTKRQKRTIKGHETGFQLNITRSVPYTPQVYFGEKVARMSSKREGKLEVDPFLDCEEILSDKWIRLAKDLLGEMPKDRL